MKKRIAFLSVLFLSVSVLLAQPPETVYEGILIAKGHKQNIPADSYGPHDIGFSFT
ncbi:MAG: hypothetical protein GX876_10730, partial [Bacteroidales bacterium]|nr:hypothetical protein [Bacteroidales bacterium]